MTLNMRTIIGGVLLAGSLMGCIPTSDGGTKDETVVDGGVVTTEPACTETCGFQCAFPMFVCWAGGRCWYGNGCTVDPDSCTITCNGYCDNMVGGSCQ